MNKRASTKNLVAGVASNTNPPDGPIESFNDLRHRLGCCQSRYTGTETVQTNDVRRRSTHVLLGLDNGKTDVRVNSQLGSLF